MKTLASHSLEETRKIASDWLQDVAKRSAHSDEALVVGLSGHLGAGKTAFVKLVAELLGVKEVVTSPTFVIMKLYELAPQAIVDKKIPWKRLVHIDAYRLERAEELEALNFEQLVADKNNLIMVEWPENVELKEFKPHAHLEFEIKEGKHLVRTHIESGDENPRRRS